jgi:hypothetical protein
MYAAVCVALRHRGAMSIFPASADRQSRAAAYRISDPRVRSDNVTPGADLLMSAARLAHSTNVSR